MILKTFFVPISRLNMRKFIIFMLHDQSNGYKFVDLIEIFFISNKIGFNIYERTRSKGCGPSTEFEWADPSTRVQWGCIGGVAER